MHPEMTPNRIVVAVTRLSRLDNVLVFLRMSVGVHHREGEHIQKSGCIDEQKWADEVFAEEKKKNQTQKGIEAHEQLNYGK